MASFGSTSTDTAGPREATRTTAPGTSTTRARAGVGYVLVSAIIVVILGLQIFAGFRNPAQWGWPFVAYPMYRGAHYENERLRYDFTTYAMLSDGSRQQIKPGDLGMDWWRFRANLIDPVFREDREALQIVVDHYCEESGQKVTGLEIEDLGVIVTRDGMKDGLPPEVVASIDVPCS
jgi:hypothetical protein